MSNKDLKEMYLDNLLYGRNATKVSPRQYLIDKQDEVPLVVMVAYLDSINERMVIEDGKIKRFIHR